MIDRYDVIVIGGGHNALVCATRLAEADRTVLLLEANQRVGGAAVTREFADGFHVSGAAQFLYQLQPAVAKAMGLKGLPMAASGLASVGLHESGNHLQVRGDRLEGVEAYDAESWREFYRVTERFARVLNRQLTRVPPRLGSERHRDTLRLLGLGLDLRRLGKANMQSFLRMIGMNLYDELAERFKNPLLGGMLSADATLGSHLGPRSPGTVLTYLYRRCGGSELSVPKGGMSALSEAMAERARTAGVEIRTGAKVTSVVVENGRVAAVETEDGERYGSQVVVSGIDPKQTVFDLVGARHFETRFVTRVKNLRGAGNVARLHLALDALPDVQGLENEALGNRLLIAPDADYVERAFNPAKYGEFSEAPVVEMTFPTVHDADLAPAGKHVLAASVQYAPYHLKEGWGDGARDAFLERTLSVLETHMPDLREKVVAAELLVPPDLEKLFGLPNGHWHHTELSFDQFFFVRPVAGAAQYALPLDGLYLCGAGAHPGGGVSGAVGLNAASAILAKDKPSWS